MEFVLQIYTTVTMWFYLYCFIISLNRINAKDENDFPLSHKVSSQLCKNQQDDFKN